MPRRFSCTRTISAMRAMKNGSMRLVRATSSAAKPARSASARWNTRSAVGRPTSSSKFSSVTRTPLPSAPRPARPFSSERRALPSASSNVRPMDMISPTAFMRVDSVSSVPWNFSNAKRGTFTTQ